MRPFLPTLGFAVVFWAVPPGARPAQACGGFWCSLNEPVNQAAERIIFVDHPDDTVTAVIQIQYRGPSEKFAWLIPIPGDPEIAISSNTAFTRLDDFTAPRYELERRVEGTCEEEPFDPWSGRLSDAGSAAEADGGAEATPSIMVVDRGSVGPYDYATISVDPALTEPAAAAIAWFEENGYDLSGVDAELLGPYLEGGLNLLAFRLTKTAGQMTGTIRPVILTYQSAKPMIPIRPTAVAAERDMGVLVWVVAQERAVPENYKSLVLNEALINWFDPLASYDDVVTAAADEASGQGFVTELAGSSRSAAEIVFSSAEETGFAELEGADYEHGLDAMWAANRLYRDWEGWRDAIAAAVTLPEGTSLDDFAADPESYRNVVQIDVQGFFAELRKHVVTPVLETQRLLRSRPYLTRLYSTMSAEEMTLDPAFTWNPDLPTVSNVHKAVQFVQCNPSVFESEAPWRVELSQGDVVRGSGRLWPFKDKGLPANLRIEQLSSEGKGEVVVDNAEEISAALRGAAPTSNTRPTPNTPSTRGATRGGPGVSQSEEPVMVTGGGGGCNLFAPRARGEGAWLALLPLAAALAGRLRARARVSRLAILPTPRSKTAELETSCAAPKMGGGSAHALADGHALRPDDGG